MLFSGGRERTVEARSILKWAKEETSTVTIGDGLIVYVRKAEGK